MLFAIAGSAAQAENASPTQVRDYRPVFQECRPVAAGGDSAVLRFAIRRMEIDGNGTLLTVDPATLATHLEREQDWSCADTDDEHQSTTRYIQAVRASVLPHAAGPVFPFGVIANGGLVHGAGSGSFVTGDLCPSHRRLDRAFLEKLQAVQSPLPLALSISGAWLISHEADFEWLRERERAGAFQITWIDHSYTHPYVPRRPLVNNFLLTSGVDMRSEILDTERLLIAHGVTPSVFFRFPGLISNPALMQMVGDDHLIVLGADAWLARSPRARSGGIVLVHLNGNEPDGLKIFSTLLEDGKLPQPFRPIDDAPADSTH